MAHFTHQGQPTTSDTQTPTTTLPKTLARQNTQMEPKENQTGKIVPPTHQNPPNTVRC
jgi:hypothetical protein